MIITLDTQAKKTSTRIKLYDDVVFLISYETIKKQNTTLSVEELFATADNFTNFIIEKDLEDRDILNCEIDNLRQEVEDENSFYIILSLSYVKLCALRKTRGNAVNIARTLVGFCQNYSGFSCFLKQLSKKENDRLLNNKRIDLLTYELRCIEKDIPMVDCSIIFDAFIESASGYTPEVIQHLENVLSEVNDKTGHRYQEKLDELRAIRKKKSVPSINIEKVNDIHNNSNVNVGT